ncbi:MAG TPA: response regulator transcription factor [Acidimicrobiales bacterium]|nr:response regulator transcription factor [Acidimicrobiales bacterium]
MLVVHTDPSTDDRLMTLCRELDADGFDVDVVDTIAGALASFDSEFPALVLLHSLPQQSSWIDFCQNVRKVADVPVVLGFPPESQTDAVLAFELGVVAYLQDPARTRELLARIRGALALATGSSYHMLHHRGPSGTYVAGDVHIDMNHREVTVCGEQVHLARLEFDLLALLLDPPRQVHTRDEIMRRVWARRPSTTSRTLDTHVRWLRQKLEKDPTNPMHLVTVWGIGFRFDADRIEVPVASD